MSDQEKLDAAWERQKLAWRGANERRPVDREADNAAWGDAEQREREGVLRGQPRRNTEDAKPRRERIHRLRDRARCAENVAELRAVIAGILVLLADEL